jgi:ABC-type xylose transport system permease subunit
LAVPVCLVSVAVVYQTLITGILLILAVVEDHMARENHHHHGAL